MPRPSMGASVSANRTRDAVDAASHKPTSVITVHSQSDAATGELQDVAGHAGHGDYAPPSHQTPDDTTSTVRRQSDSPVTEQQQMSPKNVTDHGGRGTTPRAKAATTESRNKFDWFRALRKLAPEQPAPTVQADEDGNVADDELDADIEVSAAAVVAETVSDTSPQVVEVKSCVSRDNSDEPVQIQSATCSDAGPAQSAGDEPVLSAPASDFPALSSPGSDEPAQSAGDDPVLSAPGSDEPAQSAPDINPLCRQLQSPTNSRSVSSSADAACEYPLPCVSCDLPDDPLVCHNSVACAVEVSYHDVQDAISLENAPPLATSFSCRFPVARRSSAGHISLVSVSSSHRAVCSSISATLAVSSAPPTDTHDQCTGVTVSPVGDVSQQIPAEDLVLSPPAPHELQGPATVSALTVDDLAQPGDLTQPVDLAQPGAPAAVCASTVDDLAPPGQLALRSQSPISGALMTTGLADTINDELGQGGSWSSRVVVGVSVGAGLPDIEELRRSRLKNINDAARDALLH